MPVFYFSLLTLALGVLGGLYFFIKWLVHHQKHQFYILWAVGLFLLYLFQMPFILANAKLSFVISDFNVFFILMFLATFLALALIYLGILSASTGVINKKLITFLFYWFFLSGLLVALYFFIDHGIGSTYIPQILVVFLFFIPIYLITLIALWRWLRSGGGKKLFSINLGIAMLMISSILGLLEVFLALQKIIHYPPQFWFIALMSFDLLFLLQDIGIILLLVGFCLIHTYCGKNNNNKLQ